MVRGSLEPSAFQLCGQDPNTCRYVRARLTAARQVTLDTGGAAATRVRFCWADSPQCNLYDLEGLPVGPFEIDVK